MKVLPSNVALSGSLLLFLVACDDGGSAPKTFAFTEEDLVTDNGYVDTFLDIKSGMRSFMVTAESGYWVMVDQVVDPDGQVVLDGDDWGWSDELLSMAIFPNPDVQVLNWPVRATDPALVKGTYTVTLVAYDDDGRRPNGETLHLTRFTNRDEDFSQGTLNVRMVWADGLDQDQDLVAAVESALDRWKGLYEAAGITLKVTWETSSLPVDLPQPAEGSDDIDQVSEDGNPQQVTLLLGETVDSLRYILGESGGIPGSLAPTGHSAVAIALAENAGPDFSFDDDEVDLLAMTFGHEVGHYLGLFHTVESTWDWFDALEDTPRCRDQDDCIDATGDNLMFCQAICDFTSCMPQEEITVDQSGVLQRYTGVL